MFLFAMDQSVESLKAALQRQVQKATKIDPSPLIYKITIILWFYSNISWSYIIIKYRYIFIIIYIYLFLKKNIDK